MRSLSVSFGAGRRGNEGCTAKLVTMRTARRRFKAERKAGTSNGLSFRAWAGKTFLAKACNGKLQGVVASQRRRAA